MENNNKQHSSNFGTAFVIGLLVGVGLALLFATKRGRKLLRMFTEEGMDNIPALKKYFHSAVDEFSEDEAASNPSASSGQGAVDSDYIEEKIRVADMPRSHTTRIHVDEEPERQAEQKENGSVKKHSPVKRFFRGVPKKN